MSLRLLFKLNYVLSFITFIVFDCYSQTAFTEDSLKIVENANKVLTAEVNVQNQDTLAKLLSEGVSEFSDESKDLVQFHIARFYFMRKEFSKALFVAKKNIEDHYNYNGSDAKFYNLKGVIYSLRKEYGIAIQSFLKAAKGYQYQSNFLREYVIYNNIANIYLALGDYQRAYDFSSLCFSKFRDFPQDPNYLGDRKSVV